MHVHGFECVSRWSQATAAANVVFAEKNMFKIYVCSECDDELIKE